MAEVGMEGGAMVVGEAEVGAMAAGGAEAGVTSSSLAAGTSCSTWSWGCTSRNHTLDQLDRFLGRTSDPTHRNCSLSYRYSTRRGRCNSKLADYRRRCTRSAPQRNCTSGRMGHRCSRMTPHMAENSHCIPRSEAGGRGRTASSTQ